MILYKITFFMGERLPQKSDFWSQVIVAYDKDAFKRDGSPGAHRMSKKSL